MSDLGNFIIGDGGLDLQELSAINDFDFELFGISEDDINLSQIVDNLEVTGSVTDEGP